MKHTIFCRLGLAFLALSLTLSGCKYPIEVFVNIPEETPEAPEGGGDSGSIPGDTPKEKPPEITGFTFTPVYPLRAAYAVKGKTVGRIGNPIGGTAPFTYTLASGNGSNDTDNRRFTVSGDLLQIQADSLTADAYFVCLKVTDSNGIFYAKAVTVTVAKDPAALDQEARIVSGTSFKMRYVPSGAFMMSGSATLIPMGFWMGETEVTQELYQLVMGENPSQFKDNPAPGEIQSKRPVESISWYEAVRFCNCLSVVSGREPVYKAWGVDDMDSYLKWAFSTQSATAMSNIYADENASGYRLPSKEEWMWAAIGTDRKSPGQVNTTGANKHYSGGPEGTNDGIGNYSWCDYNSSNITHEVGLKLGNELGIFDMTGNVAEWLRDGVQYGSYWATIGSLPFFSSFGSFPCNPYDKFPYSGIRLVSNQ
jgi:formylglycine-generating enzyme required for sulfatase activity